MLEYLSQRWNKLKEKLGIKKVALASTTSRQALLNELVEKGIKHNPADIVRIAKRADGIIIFLEKGNARRGLKHIFGEHEADFAKRGIPREQIADAVMTAVLEGKVVGSQRTRKIYEVTFNGRKQLIAIDVGSNGFIVGANPARLTP